MKIAASFRDEAKKIMSEYDEKIASAKEKSDIIMDKTKQEISDFLAEKEVEFEKKSSRMLLKSDEKIEKIRQRRNYFVFYFIFFIAFYCLK